jgi:elongation factor Ts
MSATEIQKLREQTGAGVMDCKNAFDSSGGDFEKAKQILVERGIAKAGKKGSRQTGAGYLESYVHAGRVGVLLEMQAETDFVTRSEDFKDCAKNIAMQIAATNPENPEALLTQPFIRDEKLTVQEYLKTIIGKVGENLNIVRFTRYEI